MGLFVDMQFVNHYRRYVGDDNAHTAEMSFIPTRSFRVACS
jgi:hypothetical protein